MATQQYKSRSGTPWEQTSKSAISEVSILTFEQSAEID